MALNFGPSVSFILTPDYTILSDKGDNLNTHSELQEGTYTEETIDVGINLGISYYLTENLLINSRLNSSLINAGTISKLTNSGYVNGTINNMPEINIYEIKNSIISFSFSYLF